MGLGELSRLRSENLRGTVVFCDVAEMVGTGVEHLGWNSLSFKACWTALSIRDVESQCWSGICITLSHRDVTRVRTEEKLSPGVPSSTARSAAPGKRSRSAARYAGVPGGGEPQREHRPLFPSSDANALATQAKEQPSELGHARLSDNASAASSRMNRCLQRGKVFRKAESDDGNTKLTEKDLEPLLVSKGGGGGAEDGPAPNANEEGGLDDALKNSPGRSIDAGVRGELESKAGQNLSDVRVHTDAKAAMAAAVISAKAFTVGRDIYFAEGTFQPNSREGRKLLAHEVAHAAQSKAGAGNSSGGEISSPGDATEVEADRFAEEFEKKSDAPTGAPKENAGNRVHLYPGVVDDAFEKDRKARIDKNNPKSPKVWTKERGYIKNPTATKLSSIVKEGTIRGSFRDGKVMYVVGEAGEIWVGHRKKQKMPHPTLIGGMNPQVRAAGMVEISRGKIVAIDNHSGHFQPPRSSLNKAADAFLKLPKTAFKNPKMRSVHLKKDQTEYWRKFRTLRMLKLQKLNIGKALKRVKGRYKHDPRFRGKMRGAGKGALGILVGALVGLSLW